MTNKIPFRCNTFVFSPSNQMQNRTENPMSMRMNFTGKELDAETGYGYFGARYMDHELMTGWLSVDPMADKYPNISPYAYCAWNPMKLVDPDGNEMLPYLIYDDKTKKLQIWDDNNTANNYNDDTFIGEYDAHNNVSTSVDCQGKWPDGEYAMLDREVSHKHGNHKDKKGRLDDSSDGAYGVGGIYRAETFTQDDGKVREGMGIHAGREYLNLEDRITYGCIRTTPEAFEAITNAIANYGPLRSIIIRNNKSSSQSSDVNKINPQQGPVFNFQPLIFQFTPVIDNTYVCPPVKYL